MNKFLTACRTRSATAMIALLALLTGAQTVRADYLVRTYADTAPAYLRSPLLPTTGSPSLNPGEPLTVYRPHEDSTEPPEPEIDEASLAAALQALLLCAIPPPVDTIIQTPTSTGTQQPGVPAAPEYILPSYPEITQEGVHTAADAPEPASLVTALVGSGLAGIVMWHRRGKPKKKRRIRARTNGSAACGLTEEDR